MPQDTKSTYKNKSLAIYTSNEHPENKKKTMPFIIVSKNIKYLGINLMEDT